MSQEDEQIESQSSSFSSLSDTDSDQSIQPSKQSLNQIKGILNRVSVNKSLIRMSNYKHNIYNTIRKTNIRQTKRISSISRNVHNINGIQGLNSNQILKKYRQSMLMRNIKKDKLIQSKLSLKRSIEKDQILKQFIDQFPTNVHNMILRECEIKELQKGSKMKVGQYSFVYILKGKGMFKSIQREIIPNVDISQLNYDNMLQQQISIIFDRNKKLKVERINAMNRKRFQQYLNKYQYMGTMYPIIEDGRSAIHEEDKFVCETDCLFITITKIQLYKIFELDLQENKYRFLYFIRQFEIFQDFNIQKMVKLYLELEKVSLEYGQIVQEQSQYYEYVYFIVQGQIKFQRHEVVDQYDARKQSVYQKVVDHDVFIMQQNQSFGMMEVYREQKSDYQVVSVSNQTEMY